MPMRLRFTGKATGQEGVEIRPRYDVDGVMAFQTGEVVALPFREALRLLRDHAGDFERVMPDEDGYDDAPEPRLVTAMAAAPAADPEVTLRSGVAFRLRPNKESEVEIDIAKNTDFQLPKSRAEELSKSMPGVFQVVDDTPEGNP